jgi:hypothetical protein
VNRPNAYALSGATVIGLMGAIATGWLWLEGRGKSIGLPAWIVKPLWAFVVAAVPGPILVSALFREHLIWVSLIVGLLLNFVLYWLVFRAIIWVLMLCRRVARGRTFSGD